MNHARQVEFCFTAFLARPFCPQEDPGKPRATIARQVLSSRKRHEFVGLFSSTHDKSISAPRRRRTAEQLHGTLGILQDTLSSRLSGHRGLYAVFSVKQRHCLCASVFFWSGTARARSFCTHQRSRLTKIAIFNTSFIWIDGSCSSSGVAGCTGCTASFVRSRSKTHLRGLPLQGFM